MAGIFAYLCVPECNHRTLEEIDQLFLDGVPVRKFSKVKHVQIIDDVVGKPDEENAKAASVHFTHNTKTVDNI